MGSADLLGLGSPSRQALVTIGLHKDAIRRIALEKMEVVYRD